MKYIIGLFGDGTPGFFAGKLLDMRKELLASRELVEEDFAEMDEDEILESYIAMRGFEQWECLDNTAQNRKAIAEFLAKMEGDANGEK